MTVYSILKKKHSGCGGADAPHDPCVCRRCTRTIESGCPAARTPAGRNGGDPLAKDTLDAVRRAQEETAALAQQLRQKAEENGPKTIRAILDRITG